MAQQTAVEWLLKNLKDKLSIEQANAIISQAKAMEEQQIIDAANGYTQTEYLGVSRGEQYYNEKYKK